MSDEIWQRDEIESPCVKLCMLHPRAKICTGCFRSGEEIASWSRFTPQQRREIMQALPAREALLSERTGRRRKIDRGG
ncbi:MAG: DUF1289 domain-containing protein [Neomegalonema sp.]|nr:DUF1289 domain-containing protein [Neomegalonema sp.]